MAWDFAPRIPQVQTHIKMQDLFMHDIQSKFPYFQITVHHYNYKIMWLIAYVSCVETMVRSSNNGIDALEGFIYCF